MSSYSNNYTALTHVDTSVAHDRILALLAQQDAPYLLHEHAPSVTILDADTNLSFPVERLVKSIAFRVKNRGWVLAALCGYSQVDYKKLAAAVGVSRDKLVRLTPDEVAQELGYELGGVSPFAPNPATQVIVDTGVLAWPSIFTGAGRNDRTLEIDPQALVRIAQARVAEIAKNE